MDAEWKMRNAQAHSTGTEAFEKRLRAYAAGAGAVAAGLLAFSPNAKAEIVVTQTHVTLERDSSPFPISIEGATQFTLSNHGGPYTSSFFVTPASGAAT